MAQLLVHVAQIIVALIMGVVASYLGLVLFNRATRDLDEREEIRKGNTAMGLVLAAIILGIALILRPALTLPPAVDVGGRMYPVYVLLAQLAGLVVGFVLALSTIVFAVVLFDQMTGQIDELAELKRGNTAVAAMLVGVILAVSLLMSEAVEQIMFWFVTFLL